MAATTFRKLDVFFAMIGAAGMAVSGWSAWKLYSASKQTTALHASAWSHANAADVRAGKALSRRTTTIDLNNISRRPLYLHRVHFVDRGHTSYEGFSQAAFGTPLAAHMLPVEEPVAHERRGQLLEPYACIDLANVTPLEYDESTAVEWHDDVRRFIADKGLAVRVTYAEEPGQLHDNCKTADVPIVVDK